MIAQRGWQPAHLGGTGHVTAGIFEDADVHRLLTHALAPDGDLAAFFAGRPVHLGPPSAFPRVPAAIRPLDAVRTGLYACEVGRGRPERGEVGRGQPERVCSRPRPGGTCV